MAQNASFAGVLTAVATPFRADQSLDEAAFGKLLRAQKANGIHGVVVCGTTGESPTLSDPERERLIGLALAERTDSFGVYVGTGTNNTAETIELSKRARSYRSPSGQRVDGVMVVVPYYNKPTQTSLIAHYKMVCDAVPDAPVCVYNVPGRTGAALAPSTFIEIAKLCPNVRAIKEAAGQIPVVSELARRLRDARLDGRIEVLSGDDPTFAPALAAGATGVISVSTHIIPKTMRAIWDAWRAGDVRGMTKAHLDVLELHDALFCASNPIPLKWALRELGLCENTLRLPLMPLDEILIPRLRDALALTASRGVELCRFEGK